MHPIWLLGCLFKQQGTVQGVPVYVAGEEGRALKKMKSCVCMLAQGGSGSVAADF